MNFELNNLYFYLFVLVLIINIILIIIIQKNLRRINENLIQSEKHNEIITNLLKLNLLSYANNNQN